MRDTVKTAFGQVKQAYDMKMWGTQDYWDGNAKLAYLVAQHYQRRRTVYALHGPVAAFPGPPFFVGVGDQFYRLDFSIPVKVVKGEASAPLATLPGEVKLVSLEFSPTEPKAGQLVEWRALWQLGEPGPPGMWFCLRMRPAGKSPLLAGWKWASEKGHFEQGFAALYGLWGMFPPSSPGTLYEQRGKFLVPTHTPTGDYGFDLGYARAIPIVYDNFVSLGNHVTLHVTAAPPPTNGP